MFVDFKEFTLLPHTYSPHMPGVTMKSFKRLSKLWNRTQQKSNERVKKKKKGLWKKLMEKGFLCCYFQAQPLFKTFKDLFNSI